VTVAAEVMPQSAIADPIPASAVAFDLDGTLLDTVHDLAAAVNALLRELGHSALDVEIVRTYVGKGMANLVRRALARSTGVSPEAIEDVELKDALARYQEHYAALLGRATKPFPRMIEGLDRLRAMRLPLAVVTNKPSRFVRPHLAEAGIASYFSVIVGGDDLPTKKPDPAQLVHAARLLGVAPSLMLMVGDSINDAQAARAAGCPVLLLPHGYNEGRSVQDIDADGIVATLADVADRIRPVTPAKPSP
jgi:phosphoglycolate phosphatase